MSVMQRRHVGQSAADKTCVRKILTNTQIPSLRFVDDLLYCKSPRNGSEFEQ